MSPVKVIVQNIPNDVNKDKKFLEQLFAEYGPVECSYVLYDENVRWRRGRILDNFAHVVFENDADATRACEAAKNREIQVDGRVLMLTAIQDDDAPIQNLDDCSLLTIFSLLGIEDKFDVDSVCKRWAALAPRCWSRVKHLNLMSSMYDEETCMDYMRKCGAYLDKISGLVGSYHFFFLIYIYCREIKEIELFFCNISKDELVVMSKVMEKLKHLKKLTCFGNLTDFSLDFVKSLPESMEEISWCVKCINPPSVSIDLTKFRNLQSLSLANCDLEEESVKGFDKMKSLRHLGFSNVAVDFSYIEKIQNFTNLKTLGVSGLGITDDDLIAIINNNRDLEVLNVNYCWDLSDRSVSYASTLPNLKNLNVGNCPNVTLKLMDAMPLLERLNCESCRSVTDEALGRLLPMTPNLNYLSVEESPVTVKLVEIVDAAVRSRDNGVGLFVMSDLDSSEIDYKKLSPLLTFEAV